MPRRLSLLWALALCLVTGSAWAGTPERTLVERDVRATLDKDMAAPWATAGDAARVCLDGKPAGDAGNAVEVWVSPECRFCGLREAFQAQQTHPEWRIVVRHMPAGGEGLKKALAFEALKQFSASAAVMFWEEILPRTDLAIPRPFEAALLRALSEAAIPQEKYSAVLEKQSVQIVMGDMLAGAGVIGSTPTWVLEGFRFASCDFTAAQLEKAMELARKARRGDAAAREAIVEIIVRGRMNEPML